MTTGTPTKHLGLPRNLPRGISDIWELPHVSLHALWEKIILDDEFKKRLVSQAILNFSLLLKALREQVPNRGVILLVGPPGTGKTSLAYGLASKLAGLLPIATSHLVEGHLQGLMRPAWNKTRTEVLEHFSQTIAELASSGPTMVLLDDVETLAQDCPVSPEVDPMGMYRVARAVIAKLDELEQRNPNVLFIATASFPHAVAYESMSRGELIVEVPPLGQRAAGQILLQCLSGFATMFPDIAAAANSLDIPKLALACEGLNAYELRNTILKAVNISQGVAPGPNKLTMDNLLNAAKEAQQARANAVHRQ